MSWTGDIVPWPQYTVKDTLPNCEFKLRLWTAHTPKRGSSEDKAKKLKGKAFKRIAFHKDNMCKQMLQWWGNCKRHSRLNYPKHTWQYTQVMKGTVVNNTGTQESCTKQSPIFKSSNFRWKLKPNNRWENSLFIWSLVWLSWTFWSKSNSQIWLQMKRHHMIHSIHQSIHL